ncbi:MAG: hypothetical protein H6696_13795 [Deferribacteres bacterium]|nr:hypothetical protein [candidate division KSB1 bacterium]MCB9502999.1 hypothetical protein [Deferribacteres bacterium]
MESMQRDKNELRRDPVNGSWTVIMKNNSKLAELLLPVDNNQNLSDESSISNLIESGEELMRESRSADSNDWLFKVIAGKQPVLQIHGPLNNRGKGLYDVCDGIGAHEIVLETHDTGLPFEDLSVDHITKVMTAYATRIVDLKRDVRFRYVMVHKMQQGTNREDFHALSHIVATPITPIKIRLKLENCKRHYQYKERCLFCDIIYQEQDNEERVVAESDHFIAISPFASSVPFHLQILPKNHEPFYENNSQIAQLAEMMKDLLTKLKRVTGQNNYEIYINSAPNIDSAKRRGYWRTLHSDYHWHIEILPLLRFKNNVKEDVGFSINPISPEKATYHLRHEDE